MAINCMHFGSPVPSWFIRTFGTAILLIVGAAIVIAFVKVVFFPSPAAPVPTAQDKIDRAALIAQATAGLELLREENKRTSYFSIKAPKKPTSVLGAYVGIHDSGKAILFIQAVYVGARAMSHKLIEVTANGETVYEKTYTPGQVKHDTDQGATMESAEFRATETDLAALRKIVASEAATLTFLGDGKRRVHKISKQQMAELKSVLDAYDRLRATL